MSLRANLIAQVVVPRLRAVAPDHPSGLAQARHLGDSGVQSGTGIGGRGLTGAVALLVGLLFGRLVRIGPVVTTMSHVAAQAPSELRLLVYPAAMVSKILLAQWLGHL